MNRMAPGAFLLAAATLLCGNLALAQDKTEEQTKSSNELFREAYQLTQGPRDEASLNKVIELCEAGLKEANDPKFVAYGKNLAAWAYNARGEKLLDAGNADEAGKDFEIAVEYDPSQIKYLHNRGFVLASQGELDKAIADFTKVLAENPEHAKARFNRGEAYFVTNDLDKAKVDYTAAIRLDDKNPSAYNARGFVFYLQGDYKAAFNDYNQALRINNRHVGALTNRGDAYADTGQYDAALSDYNGALAVDPEYHRAYASAAWLRATCPDTRTRRADLALRSAQRALEMGGDSARYQSILAAALARSGNYEEAVAAQKKALGLAKDESVSEDQMKRYQFQLERYEAGKPYTDVLEGQPQPE